MEIPDYGASDPDFLGSSYTRVDEYRQIQKSYPALIHDNCERAINREGGG